MSITQIKRIFLGLSILLALGIQPAIARQSLDKVVAIVNNDVITANELENYMKLVTAELRNQAQGSLPAKELLRYQILNRMIIDKIQEQLASQVGIEVDTLTVSQTLQNIAQQQGQTLEQFKHSIEGRGVKFSEYRDLISSELVIQRLQASEVTQNLNVADKEIESFLRTAAGQDNSGTEYRISHILIATPDAPTPDALKKVQAQAEALTLKLRSGADFAKAAMTNSAGRQALKGGDLGWRSVGELPTLFVTYVPSMKVGEVVGPIRNAGGFHIIKLQEKRMNAERINNEANINRDANQAAWNRAYEILTQRKMNEALEVWMKRIRDEAHVEILISDPNTAETKNT